MAEEKKSYKTQTKTQLTPANKHYTRYLLSTNKKASLAVQLPAILPCQWLYYEVYGKQKTNHINPYYNWLAVYQTKKYMLATKQLIALTNQLYEHSDPLTQKRMLKAFKQATLFEYQF